MGPVALSGSVKWFVKVVLLQIVAQQKTQINGKTNECKQLVIKICLTAVVKTEHMMYTYV